MRNSSPIRLLLFLLLLCPSAHADLELCAAVGENCVLQRDTAVPVWGRAEPGEAVTVTFAGQSESAAADRFGRWRIQLDPMPASAEGRDLVVKSGNNALTVKGVMVGDVWLYLSQSWHLDNRRIEEGKGVPHPEDLPPISLAGFTSVWEHQNHAQRPQDGIGAPARWTVFQKPGRYFRNDAYYLGLGLAKRTKVPVGIIGQGASTLESMTPPQGFQALEKELGDLGSEVVTWTPTTPRGREAFLSTLADVGAWVERSRATLERKDSTYGDFTQPPSLPGPPLHERGPMTNYNQVTRRFLTGAYRGIIIQPKTYSVGDPQYEAKLLALVTGLRIACGRKDVPICFMQMHSPGRYEDVKPEDPQVYVAMRDAQNKLAKLPDTTVVATYDLKETSRSEPDLGLRAAHWAAAVVSNAPAQAGPSYRRHRVEGTEVIVEFDNVGEGLMAGAWDTNQGVVPSAEAGVGGFQVAGADGQWQDAKAAIRGAAVVVTCNEVAKPVVVRYAWAPEPKGASLYNREGFPALPFTSR